jgi:MoaA/NifB/PqqE/SkfB family radical SAM enzyme
VPPEAGLRRRVLGLLRRRARLTEEAPAPPEWIILCVNNACNLRCRMCDVGLADPTTAFWDNLIGEHPRNMSLELMREVLAQAAAFRPRPKIGMAFTEPLIHPQILELCGSAVEAGFFCSVTTNGSTLPRLADALVELGLDVLHVSVDGPPAVHDDVRGVRGSFQKLYAGCEALQRRKKRDGVSRPLLGLSFTITDRNAAHLVEFLEAVAPLRPDVVNVSHLNFISERMAAAHNARHGHDLGGHLRVVRSNLGPIDPAALDPRALAAELGRARKFAGSHRRSFPKITFVPDASRAEELATYYGDELSFVGGRSCTDPWAMMMVKTDGTVIPSHGRCYSVPVGRVTGQGLRAIWNGPGLRSFRRTLLAAGGSLPACARCCGVIGKPADS